ncbi:titin-like [Anneissia japonica]|uniref:titin-like n=1 Tax=Anneissia japonica TaxID=1529436 RepID=UPI0014255ECA|nr:titin-like [Anneissia japonica]
MNILVCFIILAAITSRASGDENKLYAIEGNRIALPAHSDADNATSIEYVNWFDGGPNETHANNIIVSLVHPYQSHFSIDVTKRTYGDLIIEPVNRGDAGKYTCQVVHKDETTSRVSNYYLIVYYMDPPIISINWNSNSRATFYCSWSIINPDNKPIVRWYLDGSELNTTKAKFNSDEEERKATLVTLNISEQDFGNYTCSITVNTNKGVMNKTSKGLHTTDDRKALIKGVLIANVLEGSSQVTMPCEYSAVEGNVDTIMWNEVDNSGKNVDVAIIDSTKKENGRYKLIKEPGVANLIIESPTRDDSGRRFKCLVIFHNKPPAILDPPSLLNVLYLDKPEVTVSPSVVFEGNSFTLTCSNINVNPPTPIQVTWLKDNIIISSNDSSRYELYEDFNRIRIPFASVDDSGIYQCRVQNDAHRKGRTSLELNISVFKGLCLPVKVSTFTVLIVTAVTSFILGSFTTCLICHCIRKSPKMESRNHYEMHQNEVVQLNSVENSSRATHNDDGAAAGNSPQEENEHESRLEFNVVYSDAKYDIINAYEYEQSKPI